jgi:hypothetical protein
MSAGRLVALALAGIVVAIVAGASVGGALAPDGVVSPTAPAAVRPAAPALALRSVLGPLDRARSLGRSALRLAHTTAGQAAAARQLAVAHRRAAAELGEPLSTLLAATARAYDALGAAARSASAARYLRARRAVGAAEAALGRAVDTARRPASAGQAAQASSSRPDRGSGPLLLVLLGLAATAVIGLFVGTATGPRPVVTETVVTSRRSR